MHLAIKSDGSHDIGLGHLYRSSVVAREALGRGHRITFATRTPETAAEIFPERAEVTSLPDDGEVETFVDWLTDTRVDSVILDLPSADPAYQERLRSTGIPLTIVSDDARHRVCTDIVVNGNLYAPQIEYDWIGPEPMWCLGSDYLLLREPFSSLAAETQPFSTEPRTIVLTMGGVDKDDRTPIAMAGVADFDLAVTVIVGPGFENVEKIRETAQKLDGRFTIRHDPEDLPELFVEADFAVCTLGTTTYELLATQTPIIGIPDNETPIDTALEAEKAAIVLSRQPSSAEVSEAAARVIENPTLRRRLWAAGGKLVTGEGGQNVVNAIERSVLRAQSS